tara:strand:- start:367 stop:633 length:267 start_codon:yes stop_codon:yes gene_type:complete
MPKIHHRKDSILSQFSGGPDSIRRFERGTTRDVSTDTAAYCLKHYPECFELVEDVETKSAAVAKPSKTTAAKPPAKRRRKAPAKKAAK